MSLIGLHRYFNRFPTRESAGRRLVRVAALLCLVCCAPAVAAEQDASLTIGATGGEFTTMRLLGEAFQQANPGIRVTVLFSLGNTGGINATLAGAIDVGTSSRPVTDLERGKGAQAVEYGRTPLVFVVASTNPVTMITTAQLADVYAGRQFDWPDGTRVRPVLRPDTDVTTLLLKQQLPAIAAAMVAAEKRQGMQFALTDQDCAIAIANIPGAVGPMTLSEIRTDASTLRPLVLDGVVPDVQTIADASYSAYESFYLITGRTPTELATRFLAFVSSSAGSSILLGTAHWVANAASPR